LCVQAEIAATAGYPQLAANLRRAAELTALPNDELLRAYEALRPGRSTIAEIRALADRLETEYGARETAAFVREAAEAYAARGLAQ
jgi:propanediol dehydratase small subunit